MFRWKQGASFLDYAAIVIGRACFLPYKVEFKERKSSAFREFLVWWDSEAPH